MAIAPPGARCRSGTGPIPARYDRELFRQEILPRLATVKLSEIVEAAGCSKAYASGIRRGLVDANRKPATEPQGLQPPAQSVVETLTEKGST